MPYGTIHHLSKYYFPFPFVILQSGITTKLKQTQHHCHDLWQLLGSHHIWAAENVSNCKCYFLQKKNNQADLLCLVLVGKIEHISHVLGVGFTEIVQAVCVISLYCKSILYVLHVRYVLVTNFCM